MKNKINRPLAAPPLTAFDKPWGVIRFIHFRDGKEHEFYTVVNEMTGSRLSAFDNDPPSIDDPPAWICSVFRDIRAKSTKVLGFVGNIKL